MRQHERTSYDEAHDHETQPCPVCTGEEAPPCSEECAEQMLRAAAVQQTKRVYSAARRALGLARRYYVESNGADHRVVACVSQVRKYRHAIRAMRLFVGSELREAA